LKGPAAYIKPFERSKYALFYRSPLIWLSKREFWAALEIWLLVPEEGVELLIRIRIQPNSGRLLLKVWHVGGKNRLK
jgi:hypothetical protein